MLRRITVQEYFFFYLLVFSQLFGVHLGSKLESLLLVKSEEKLLGIKDGSTYPTKVLSDARNVNAFAADLKTNTLYYYDTEKKIIYSKPLDGGSPTEEFSYNLEGLFSIDIDTADNNLYFGVYKENSGSFIVVCSLRTPRSERKCTTILEEKNQIISYLKVKSEFVLLIKYIEEDKQKVEICPGDCKTIVVLEGDEEFVGGITYDYNSQKVIWATSKSVIGFYSLIDESSRSHTSEKSIELNSLAFFNGKIFGAEKGTGEFYHWSIKKDYEREADLEIGTVSAMRTSHYKNDAKSFCTSKTCPKGICISMKTASGCPCPVAAISGNCEDLPKTKVAIGILMSRSSIIQFYPDAMGMFHSKVVYTFTPPHSAVIGDYVVKTNSFIYIVHSKGYAEFYKIDLYTKKSHLIDRLQDINVRSIAVDQRTGNIYYSSNLGIRILTESSRQGRFKSSVDSYDYGKIFINPFKYQLHAFRRHKHNNETMIINYDMFLDDVSRSLFFFEPKDAFGMEATKDDNVIAGHVTGRSSDYRVVVESLKNFEETKISLKREPSHINPHGSQLFYVVDNELISHDIKSVDSKEKVVLKSSDSIDVLKIYTSDFKLIHMNACKKNKCSDVCVMISEEKTKCVCPSFSFLLADKKTCQSSFCQKKSEYYCKESNGGSCKPFSDRKGCNNQGNCLDDSDEFDCEHEYWISSFCNEDTEYYCKSSLYPKCERKEDLCSGIDRPRCLNTIDENEICKDFKECKTTEFKCKNSKPLFAICKDKSKVCDGTPDCRDNSDEDGCSSKCRPDQFSCGQVNSKPLVQCVENTTLCNGKSDCANDFDEDRNMCHDYCLKNDKFKCDYYGYTCVPKSLKCDGNNDCPDGSDEKDCVRCLDSEHKCTDYSGDTICSKRCDGNSECDDESDEKDCNCDENNVTCDSHICIDHKTWCLNPYPKKCSNPRNIPLCIATINSISSTSTRGASTTIPTTTTTDADTSPTTTTSPTTITITSDATTSSNISAPLSKHSLTLLTNCSNDEERLCKDRTKCIHIKLFCDYSDDCPDGSDEGGLCEDPDVCKRSQICSKGTCFRFPWSEPICKCPQGYSQTKSDCIDINECENDNPCDQICKNLDGHYKCSCKAGYTIDNEKGTCKSNHLPTFWIGTHSKLYQYSENYDIALKWQVQNEKHLSAVTSMSNIILSEVGKDSSTIYQFNNLYPDQNRTIMKFGDSTILGLAYDWINENIYYTEYKHNGNYNDKGTIGVCNIKRDETLCKTLKVADSKRFSKIAVDPNKGYVYWVEFQGRYTIRKADMDLSPNSMRTLFEPDIQTEPLLAVDYAINLVYSYYDGKLHSVNPEMPKKVRTQNLYLDAPKSMDFFENKLYFGAQEGLIEYSIRSNVHKTIYRLNDQVTCILVSHQLRQPKDSNEHETACYPACLPKEICLMNPKGASCVQSDKIYMVTQQPTNLPNEFQTTNSLPKYQEKLSLNGNTSEICDFCLNGKCIVKDDNTTICKCSPGFRGENCTLLDDHPDNGGSKMKKSIIIGCIIGILIILAAVLLVCFWERLKKWSRKPLKMCAGLTTMIFRRSEDERNLVENPGFVEDVHEIDEKDGDRYVEMSYNSVGNDTANSDEPTVQLIIR